MLRQICTLLLFQTSIAFLLPKSNSTDLIDEYFNANSSSSKALGYHDAPDYFDWRDKEMVSPVKDQGKCAACWAFSIVGNIESQHAIRNNQKVVLSEQFLMDCVTVANGCDSSSILKAWGFIITNLGGILKSNDYEPYTEDKHQCQWHKGPPYPMPVMGFKRVRSNEETMKLALWQHGPLSAAINSKSMDNYKGHYIDEPTEEQCSSKPEDMDHTILIVGYNEYRDDSGKRVPYWIIKNSWGKQWGDKGFYYLVRGRNACGISNDVSYGQVTG